MNAGNVDVTGAVFFSIDNQPPFARADVSIAEGQNKSVSATSTLIAGAHIIYVKAEPSGNLMDANSSDNIAWVYASSRIALDLSIEGGALMIYGDGSNYLEGSKVVVVAYVKNPGQNDVSDAKVSFFMDGSVAIGNDTVPVPAQSSARAIAVWYPPAGAHKVSATVATHDGFDVDSSNDSASANVVVLADANRNGVADVSEVSTNPAAGHIDVSNIEFVAGLTIISIGLVAATMMLRPPRKRS